MYHCRNLMQEKYNINIVRFNEVLTLFKFVDDIPVFVVEKY